MPTDDLPIPSSTSTIVELMDTIDYKDTQVNAEMFSPVEEIKFTLVEPTPLKNMKFSLIWDNLLSSSSSFMKEYHEARTDVDNVVPKWELGPERCNGVRLFTCTTLVDESPTAFYEAQRFAVVRENGKVKLFLQLSAQTPKVMAGTTFRCETLMKFIEDPDDVCVNISIFGNMRKMSFGFSIISGIATPRAMDVLSKSYVIFMRMISERLLNGALVVPEKPVHRMQAVARGPPFYKRVDWASVATAAVALALLLSVIHTTWTLRSSASYLAQWETRTAGDDPWLEINRTNVDVDPLLRSLGFSDLYSSGGSAAANGNCTCGQGVNEALEMQVQVLEEEVESLRTSLSSWSYMLMIGFFLALLREVVGIFTKLKRST